MSSKTSLLKALAITACLLPLLSVLSCSRLKYDVTPSAHAVYYAVTLKVNVKVIEDNAAKRQSFKIVLKYDDSRDKMLFLSPLNQVYGQLLIEDESALLINTRRKRYWTGSFNRLIREIWSLDFNYAQFKELILTGETPREKVKESGLNISLEKDDVTEKPKRITIQHKDMTIRIKLSNHRTGNGIIDFTPRIKGMAKTSIDDVLEN